MEPPGTPDLTSGVYITEELERRLPRRADALREKQAILELADLMGHRPERILPRFVDLAMELTGGVSAGLSLFQERPAPGRFHWRYLRGLLAPFEDLSLPRDSGPSGFTLDRGSPVLARHPERAFGWISDAGIQLPEVLLVPLNLGGDTPLGTLWIVSATTGHFDSGDARAMTELAGFVGTAMRMVRAEGRLQRALDAQETLARETSQRLRNLFALTEGIIRSSLRRPGTRDELVAKLSGRMRVVSLANALLRRGAQGVASHASELSVVVEQVLRPHEDPTPGAPHRFAWTGPPVRCGETAVIGLALTLHELAANAAAHGALTVPAGRVDLSWRFQGQGLVLRWSERDGPPVAGEPATWGFGAEIVHDAIVQRLIGTVAYEWAPQGLVVTITLPLANLAI